MSKENPVLILGLYQGGLDIARSLGKKGIKVFGIDNAEEIIGSFSKWITRLHAPKKNEELRDYLIEFSKRCNSKPVLYTTSDTYLVLVLKYHDILSKYFCYPDNFNVAKKLVSKVETAKLFQYLKINCPKTYIIKKGFQSIPQINDIKFPVILKPDYHDLWQEEKSIVEYIGRGQRVKIIKDGNELESAVNMLGSFSDMVLQEWIPGPSKNSFYYTGYRSENSRTTIACVGQKIKTYPNGTGSEVLLTAVNIPEIKKQGNEILDNLNYIGHAGIDFKYDDYDKSFNVIEINSRFGINDGFCVDFPYIYYQDMLGVLTEQQCNYPDGITWCDFEKNIEWIIEYGKMKDIFTFFISMLKGYDKYALFDWKDMNPSMKEWKSFCIRVIKYTGVCT